MAVMSRTHQGQLVEQLKIIFPDEKPEINARKASNLKYNTETYMELDIWFPKYNICFEFQDDYHYVTTWFYHRPQSKIQIKDNITVRQNGLSLIVIPCWWDGSLEVLQSEIHFQRPDLFFSNESDKNVSLNPPPNFFSSSEIPDVGELMLASFPMMGTSFSTSTYGDNWWMGEKYDGIRFCWSAAQENLYSRNGKDLSIIPKMRQSLPTNLFIDGEIWFGRDQFSLTFMVYNGSIDLVQWQFLRMNAFDVPSVDFHQQPFEDRYSSLLENISHTHPFTLVVPRVKLKNDKHVKLYIHNIIDDGGEGVVVRKANSLYEHGRTPSLLKLKTMHSDREAIVTAANDDGSLFIQLPSGIAVKVSREHILTTPLPKKGDIVTFSSDNHARMEIPLNPKIFRVRNDVSWEEVVNNHSNEMKFLSEYSPMEGFKAKPTGFWTKERMRQYLEAFAKSKNLNPLDPASWYNSYKSFYKLKKGKMILRKFKGGYPTMLQRLFPEVKFDNHAFKKSSWESIENRRKFFEDYAKVNNFDPQIANEWYRQPREKILSLKGIDRVIFYHRHSVSRALIDLFPNIGLEKSKFQIKRHPSVWSDSANRRKVYEEYAHLHNFSPLDPEQWYLQPYEHLKTAGGMIPFEVVQYYHKGSAARALMDLFPEIGLDYLKFKKTMWNTPEARRNFFEDYANSQGFDPLIAYHWYIEPQDKILATKGADRVIYYHDKSISSSLIDLFPEVGFDKTMFRVRSFWNDTNNQRSFFINYAKQNSFDPLVCSNWYEQPRAKIMETKGAIGLMAYYDNSIPRALMSLFPELNFDNTKFHTRAIWQTTQNRKKFFENFAIENGFDPLNAEMWYLQPVEKILSVKGTRRVIFYHNHSISKALNDLFPTIKIDKSKFTSIV